MAPPKKLLTTQFIGTSKSGNLKEAIQDALAQARKKFDKTLAWEIDKIAENRLTFPPLSVQIRVGPQGKGEGGGIGPH
jgi:hypothetical protein